MPKIAYLDCPSGIAGDMCLGALVHAGVPLDYLIQQLMQLGIADEYQLWAEQVHHHGQAATKVHVDLIEAASTTVSTNSPQHSHPDRHHDRPEHHSYADRPDQHSHPHVTQNVPNKSDGIVAPPRDDPSDDHPPNLNHPAHNHQDPDHTDHEHPETDHPTHTHSHPPACKVPTRHLKDIEGLIRSAQLPERVKQWSLQIFQNLAIAEGAVHGVPPETVHFHEVGATDAIVDIVGTCLGLDWLKIDHLSCSALPTGGGTVWVAHGRLPVPVPAVLKLWETRQVPVYSNGIERELVTPTGAAIVTTLAQHFGPPPAMILQKIGLGAGDRKLPIANVLRLWIGDSSSEFVKLATPPVASQARLQANTECVILLQTQLDDLSPQAIGYVFEQLFAVGALDVFTQAIGMKKCRPGILLSVVCEADRVTDCETVLFRETTTLGIRRLVQERTVLQREIQTVQLPQGNVRIKIAWAADGHQDSPINIQPEYEDCAAIARQYQIPWQAVQRAALRIWYAIGTSNSTLNDRV